MKATSAGGFGCLAGGLSFLGLVVVIQVLLPLFRPLFLSLFKSYGDLFGIVFSFTMFALAIVGGFVGAALARTVKNQPLRNSVAQKLQEIRDCDRSIAPLQEHLEAAQKELSKFQEWCSAGDLAA